MINGEPVERYNLQHIFKIESGNVAISIFSKKIVGIMVRKKTKSC